MDLRGTRAGSRCSGRRDRHKRIGTTIMMSADVHVHQQGTA